MRFKRWFAFWWWLMAYVPNRLKPWVLAIGLRRWPHREEASSE